MSFVNALNKALLFLANEKHQTPREKDFELENMVSLSQLNRDVYDYCEFIDIAPLVFQRIRFQDGINNEDFIKDIGYNDFKAIMSKKMDSLKEEKSTGKSGSIFFQSTNGKYFIKTIRDSEVKILRKTLKAYYKHLETNLDSLLSRYYGLHKLRFYKNGKLKKSFFLVIMNNVFHDGVTPISPDALFDLKGSTYNRRTSKEKLAMKAAGKDLNFLELIKEDKIKMQINPNRRHSLLETIKKDSQFLATSNIIDYSILVGLVNNKLHSNKKPAEMISKFPKLDALSSNFDPNISKKSLPALINPQLDSDPEALKKISTFIKTKSHLSKFLNQAKSFEGPSHIIEMGDQTLYIGIIDTLTNYGGLKKVEFVFKSCFQGSGISCWPPSKYQKRFTNFMTKVLEDK